VKLTHRAYADALQQLWVAAGEPSNRAVSNMTYSLKGEKVTVCHETVRKYLHEVFLPTNLKKLTAIIKALVAMSKDSADEAETVRRIHGLCLSALADSDK